MIVPDPLGRIRIQVMWDRLIAVVEEQAQVLLRTAFGAITREAGDLSAGVYDLKGRMLAQAVTGTPGHVNTMAVAVAHFLERFPIATMRPGDAFVTNDPWMGTGHLFDFVVVTPTFCRGEPVALFASTCHVIDIGGRGFTADARSVFEEGLQIPHMHLMQAGVRNEVLFRLIEANVREPVQVVGDIMSLVSCNDTGCRRLLAMMEEFRLSSLDDLAEHIVGQSRDAMLAAIRAVPAGRYRHTMRLDGYEKPIDLVATMTVDADGIHVDYAGSSTASRFGINSPLCYTHAYSTFGIKCIVAPDVPNNAGSLSTVTVTAPEGSAVHPLPPAPVTARHVIGQMLADLMFGCLDRALPGKVPAEGAGSMWVLAMSAGTSATTQGSLANAANFTAMSVGIGGVGARPNKDGLNCTAFPSGVGAIPVEITEAGCPLVFWRRELLPDSGGPGEWRGGLSQIVEIENRLEAPFYVSAATFDRMAHPPRGRHGGRDGRTGRLRLKSGRVFADKGLHEVPAGDRLIVELPGGGGIGRPTRRDPHLVAAEVGRELLSVEAADRDYGVVVGADGRLDAAGTARLRGDDAPPNLLHKGGGKSETPSPSMAEGRDGRGADFDRIV
jgi:N-methylhydantoinase B